METDLSASAASGSTISILRYNDTIVIGEAYKGDLNPSECSTFIQVKVPGGERDVLTVSCVEQHSLVGRLWHLVEAARDVRSCGGANELVAGAREVALGLALGSWPVNHFVNKQACLRFNSHFCCTINPQYIGFCLLHH